MNYATPYELKDDRGNLFANKKKNKEGSPDWSGKIKLNGQEFYLSAWEKKTKTGDTFFSVSLGKMVPAQQIISLQLPKGGVVLTAPLTTNVKMVTISNVHLTIKDKWTCHCGRHTGLVLLSKFVMTVNRVI